jgi:hypothetical protein
LAHGIAVRAIRARGKRGVKVGFAENAEVAVPVTLIFSLQAQMFDSILVKECGRGESCLSLFSVFSSC